MINFFCGNYSPDLEPFCSALGYEKTLFLEKNFVILKGNNKKKILQDIKQAKKINLLVIYHPVEEAMLRFTLEKTAADIIIGQELIHPKDSVHYVRGGLDQILCTIAAAKGKTIAYSFHELLHAQNKTQLLQRMMFNITLCRKYNVKMIFSTFAVDKTDLRSAKDLEAFQRILKF